MTHPAAGATQHAAQILVEVLRRVLVVHFDLEDAETVHPGDEARQRRLAGAARADQQQVPLRLAEDAVDAQHVIEHLVEQHQRHVELLLVEHLRACQ